METSWVLLAFIAIFAHPPHFTDTFPGFLAAPVKWVTAWGTDCFIAMTSLPSRETDFGTVGGAGEMTKAIVPRPTEDDALVSKEPLGALDPVPIFQVTGTNRLLFFFPVRTGMDNFGVSDSH